MVRSIVQCSAVLTYTYKRRAADWRPGSFSNAKRRSWYAPPWIARYAACGCSLSITCGRRHRHVRHRCRGLVPRRRAVRCRAVPRRAVRHEAHWDALHLNEETRGSQSCRAVPRRAVRHEVHWDALHLNEETRGSQSRRAVPRRAVRHELRWGAARPDCKRHRWCGLRLRVIRAERLNVRCRRRDRLRRDSFLHHRHGSDGLPTRGHSPNRPMDPCPRRCRCRNNPTRNIP
jgi:hypothetical protein